MTFTRYFVNKFTFVTLLVFVTSGYHNTLHYDTKVVGHAEQLETLELVSQNYW